MSSGAARVTESADGRIDLMIVPDPAFRAAAGGAAERVEAEAPEAVRPGSLIRFPGHAETAGPATARLAPGTAYVVAKRSLDILVASVAIVVLLPVFVVVALAIISTSHGPVLFSQQRCGQGGRAFRLFKFRTMVTDAERIRHELAHLNEMTGPMFKVRLDPRITRVGRLLRKFSVDELPQLFNVLWGDMTLVGPRPSIVAEVDAFTELQRRRLDVKPGLTCLWQVSGRSDLGFDEWVALDLAYIEQRSFWLDLRILLRTVPAVLSGRGAY